MSMQKVKVRGQRSRSQRSKTQFSRFRTVTPVWIYIWWWNDAQRLMLLWRGALLFCKIIRQISRSHGTKSPILTRIENFRTVTPALIHWWLWSDAQSLKQHRRGALLILKVIRQILRSHGAKKLLILTQIERFRTVTQVWNHRWLGNDAQSLA